MKVALPTFDNVPLVSVVSLPTASVFTPAPPSTTPPPNEASGPRISKSLPAPKRTAVPPWPMIVPLLVSVLLPMVCPSSTNRTPIPEVGSVPMIVPLLTSVFEKLPLNNAPTLPPWIRPLFVTLRLPALA